MVVQSQVRAASAATTRQGATSTHRILGTLGMLGSPFLFLSFAVNGFQQGDSNRLGAALGLVFALGWFANVLGLRVLGAAGRRLPAQILLAVELVGVALACLFQVYEFAAPGSASLLYTVTDIAWPLSMLLLLITGIAVLRARVFEGWLRFVPLGAALWLPLGIAAMGVLGLTAGQAISGVHTMIGWFLLGYAVRRGGRLAVRD